MEPAGVSFAVVVSDNHVEPNKSHVIVRFLGSGEVGKESCSLFQAVWKQPSEITCAQEFFDPILDESNRSDFVPVEGRDVSFLKQLLGIESCNFSYDEVSQLWIMHVEHLHHDWLLSVNSSPNVVALCFNSSISNKSSLVDCWLCQALARDQPRSLPSAEQVESMVGLFTNLANITPDSLR